MIKIQLSSKPPIFNEWTHTDLISKGWIPLKEPKTLVSATLYSIPLMVINCLITLGMIALYSSHPIIRNVPRDSFTITIDLSVIIGVILVIIIHEFIHFIFIPNALKSEDILIGLTFFGAFVHTEQALSKKRYIWISMAPFCILSLLLPLVLNIFGVLTGTVLFCVLLNSLGASLDIMGVFLVLIQAPKNSMIKLNGPRTYWQSVQ